MALATGTPAPPRFLAMEDVFDRVARNPAMAAGLSSDALRAVWTATGDFMYDALGRQRRSAIIPNFCHLLLQRKGPKTSAAPPHDQRLKTGADAGRSDKHGSTTGGDRAPGTRSDTVVGGKTEFTPVVMLLPAFTSGYGLYGNTSTAVPGSMYSIPAAPAVILNTSALAIQCGDGVPRHQILNALRDIVREIGTAVQNGDSVEVPAGPVTMYFKAKRFTTAWDPMLKAQLRGDAPPIPMQSMASPRAGAIPAPPRSARPSTGTGGLHTVGGPSVVPRPPTGSATPRPRTSDTASNAGQWTPRRVSERQPQHSPRQAADAKSSLPPALRATMAEDASVQRQSRGGISSSSGPGASDGGRDALDDLVPRAATPRAMTPRSGESTPRRMASTPRRAVEPTGMTPNATMNQTTGSTGAYCCSHSQTRTGRPGSQPRVNRKTACDAIVHEAVAPEATPFVRQKARKTVYRRMRGGAFEQGLSEQLEEKHAAKAAIAAEDQQHAQAIRDALQREREENQERMLMMQHENQLANGVNQTMAVARDRRQIPKSYEAGDIFGKDRVFYQKPAGHDVGILEAQLEERRLKREMQQLEDNEFGRIQWLESERAREEDAQRILDVKARKDREASEIARMAAHRKAVKEAEAAEEAAMDRELKGIAFERHGKKLADRSREIQRSNLEFVRERELAAREAKEVEKAQVSAAIDVHRKWREGQDAADRDVKKKKQGEMETAWMAQIKEHSKKLQDEKMRDRKWKDKVFLRNESSEDDTDSDVEDSAFDKDQMKAMVGTKSQEYKKMRGSRFGACTFCPECPDCSECYCCPKHRAAFGTGSRVF